MGSLGVLAMSLKLNIENFSAELKKVQEDIKATQEKLGGFEKLGKGFESAGKSLTLGVTTPIVGAGAAAVKFASDMETSMAKVGTIADTTQVPIEDLKKSIVTMSNESGESTAILTEGLYDALSSGVQTKDAMTFLGVAVKDAKGGFTDTATAVDGLTSVLNGYGLQATDATKISNEMMVAQNLGKTTFGEMAGVMGNVVPTANALKVKSDELFSSMAVLTANGIQTSESVTGLKAAFSNIIKPSKEASDAAGALGIKFTASEVASKGWKGFLMEIKDKLKETAPEYAKLIERQGQLQASMTALEKGGKKNTDEYKNMSAELKKVTGDAKALATGSDSTISSFATMFGSVEGLNTVLTLTSDQGMKLYDESMKQMGGSTDYVNKAYETMNNTTSANFTKIKETFKNTLADLGTQLIPLVTKGMQAILSLIKGFNDLSPSAKNAIMVIAGIAATVGPTLLIIGKFCTAITSIGSAITTLKSAYAIVKGFKIVASLGKIKTAFTAMKGVMSLTSILPLITGPVGIAIACIAGIIAIGVLVYKNWDYLKEKTSQIWNSIKGFVKEHTVGISTAIAGPLGGVVAIVVKNWDSIKQKTGEAWAKVKDFCKEHTVGIATVIGGPLGGVVATVAKNWDSIKTTTSEKWGQAKEFAKNHVVGISTAIAGPLGGIVATVAKNWDSIKTTTAEKYNSIKESVLTSFEKLKTSVPGKLNEIKNKFTEGFKFLSELKTKALTWGSDMIDGFVKGIRNSIGKVTEAVKSVGNKVKSYLHFSTPDEGPLAEYEEWMPDFMAGLGSGIRDNTNKVLTPLQNLANSMNISSKLVLQPSIAPTSSASSLASNQAIGYTNNAPMMHVDKLYVNSESDITNISRSIYNENVNVIRALGKR